MIKTPVCCRKLPAYPGTKSPFSKLVVFDYCDGAIAGILQCEICSTAYRFEMLDIDPDWDEGLDVRIFLLSQLSPVAFNSLVEVCQELFGLPDWPIWVLIWNVGALDEQNKVARKISEIEHRVINFQIIVAATDLSQQIIVAKNLDWFSLLGLSRKTAK